jgi:Tripartite tricarboxylate transporter family receptor
MMPRVGRGFFVFLVVPLDPSPGSSRGGRGRPGRDGRTIDTAPEDGHPNEQRGDAENACDRPFEKGKEGAIRFDHGGHEILLQHFAKHETKDRRRDRLPYTGSAPALNALVAGQTQLMFTDLGPSLPLIRRGKLRALGMTTAERVATAPEIPPLAEVGVPGYDAAAWSMLIAPSKTPRTILTRLNAELNAIVNTAEVKQQRLQESQPQQAGVLIAAEDMGKGSGEQSKV